jgi:hypothetical protein
MPHRQNFGSIFVYGLAICIAWYVLSTGYNTLFSGFKPGQLAHGAIKRAPTKPFVIVTTTPEVPSVEEDIEDPWAMPFNNPA